MINRILLFIVGACMITSTNACTAFMIHYKGKIFLCKSFDYEDGDGLVRFNPAGNIFMDENTGTTWEAAYSSITFCYKQPACTLGGMNEKGLVIEELSTLPFPFMEKQDMIQLNEFQWISYHLDNCASVEEVIRNQQYINMLPQRHFLHYILADAQGDVAIIEFGNDGVRIYRGDELPYALLSNNPYERSLKYLSRFKGFGGQYEIPHGNASCDRFVRGAKCCSDVITDCSMTSCFSILDSLKHYDTQWQIVYDIPGRMIYFRDQGSSFEHCIDLDSFNSAIRKEELIVNLFDYKGSERLSDLVQRD